MSQPNAPLVEVSKISIEEGFNVRTHMDKERLNRLAANYGRAGVVQPIVVIPAEQDGHYTVVAGHRRLRAAEIAGLEEIPAVLGDERTARLANLVENIHQEQLDPIDRARGLKLLAEEFEFTTNKQIAEEVSMSTPWVSQHLRLLNLPEGVQRYVAEGIAPVDAERCLREVAKVSPRIAECVCELAKRRKVKPSHFVGSFGELLIEAAEARFEEKPTMVPCGSVRLGEVVADAEQRRALIERYRAARPSDSSEDPMIRFGEAEVDAARAAGCLVEHQIDHGEWVSTVSFITDLELAGDLAERAITQIESDAAEQAKREKEWHARINGTDPEATPEQEKEARKAKRVEAKQAEEQARRFNEELGRKLLKRRGGASRKQHSLARFKVLAAAFLRGNPELAARGLRLVLPQLHDVEVKRLKSGEPREKVSYADPQQAAEYLAQRVEAAASVNEGLEWIGDAFLAAVLADEEALPRSRRTGSQANPGNWVAEQMAADVKAVRPRRQRPKGDK